MLGTTLVATSVSAQSTYYGVATVLSQTDAEAACAADGGNLASMHSDEDHLLVIAACNAVSDTGNCWIGLSDAAVEGTWAWTDGTPLDYENWNAGEPNAWGPGPERCMVAWPATEDSDGCASVDPLGADACAAQGACTYYAAGDAQPSIPEQFNTGNPGDAALSPEDGVNILGLVSDTGDPVDSSDDGKWNDADPSETRAYVCFGVAPLNCDAFVCPGDVLKPAPSTITCASDPCTAEECCNPTCGDVDDDGDAGSEDDDAFALSDCAAGLVLKSDPLTVGCVSSTCTSDDCCEAPPPAPATSTPAATSAGRVAQAATMVVILALATTA